jgi:hypothetical protein
VGFVVDIGLSLNIAKLLGRDALIIRSQRVAIVLFGFLLQQIAPGKSMLYLEMWGARSEVINIIFSR